ncbi:MAG: MBL fold metallo-hydrolase [Dehalococcoidales bacterium]|nr:MBL fold metallo-hydrolase [Dehalococcoidales bacterium]
MKLTKNLYFYPEKGMLDCNTYVIRDNISIIIDPGLTQFLPELLQDLHRDGIDPKDIGIITNTHLHGDHYWANEAFKKISGAKIVSHPIQKKFWDTTVIQTSRFFGLPTAEFTEDRLLDNDKLSAGELEFELIHSPGHSSDSICFYCKSEKILICGDVIFNQNTGRVDLPGGNADELKQSILKLSQLEIEYLLPGHMDIIIGQEKVKNNFEFVKKYIFSQL